MAHRLALRSDIIVKGQNHSGESGSGPFLDAVQPRLVIATSCDFPSYERVSDGWAENLQKRGIKLFRQDETGAVILRFRQDSREAQSYSYGRNLSQLQPVNGRAFFPKNTPKFALREIGITLADCKIGI